MKNKVPKPLIIGVLTAFVAGVAMLFAIKKKVKKTGQPSSKAPQLDLENPGTQDDFPKPPMGSEIG